MSDSKAYYSAPRFYSENRRKMTDLPPAKPAPWLGKNVPCIGCNAEILNRIERADGRVSLRVLHENHCNAC